jgi:hypothetical protein
VIELSAGVDVVEESREAEMTVILIHVRFHEYRDTMSVYPFVALQKWLPHSAYELEALLGPARIGFEMSQFVGLGVEKGSALMEAGDESDWVVAVAAAHWVQQNERTVVHRLVDGHIQRAHRAGKAGCLDGNHRPRASTSQPHDSNPGDSLSKY